MGIEIRKAKESDSTFIAQMMLQSSRAGKKDGIFDIIFNHADEKTIVKKLGELIQTQAKAHCNINNFLIAESNGKSVGSLCSYEPRISTKEEFINALKEIGVEDLSEAIAVMSCCDFNQNNRTLMFDYMEELEGFIDVGVLKALMQKSLLTARLKGYRIGQTLVEIGSLETILFYKTLGFTLKEEKECEVYKEKFGRPGQALLELEF